MFRPTLHLMRESSRHSGPSLWPRVCAPLVVFCFLLAAGLLAGRASQARAEENGAVPDAPGSISGVVRGPNNAPAANITVELYRRGFDGQYSYVIRTTVSAVDGAYRFGLLGVGFYRLRFSDPTRQLGTLYYPTALSLAEAQDIPVAGVDVTNVDVTLPLAGAIRGAVTSDVQIPFGRYITLYVLRGVEQKWDTVAYTYSALTPVTPTVNYLMGGLAPGVYKVCAYDYFSSYETPYRCYNNVAAGIQYGNDVAVTGGNTTTGIDITLDGDADLASISGRVTALNGGALPTLTVQLLRRDPNWEYPFLYLLRWAQTNANGVYTFTHLPPAAYVVGFGGHASNYIQEYYKDAPTIEAATPITVARYEQRSGVDASLSPGGLITGQITILGESAGGFGSVYIYATPVKIDPSYCCNYSGYSDSAGNYRIAGLPPGVYTVAANAYLAGVDMYFSGYYGGKDSVSAIPITISGAVTVPGIDVDMGQGAFEARIAGQVTDSKAQPLTGIKVEIYRAGFEQKPFYHTVTGGDGHYSIDGLLDAGYQIGFRDPAGVYGSEFYTGARTIWEAAVLYPTGARPLTQVNASLLRSGGLSGRATYTDGIGAPNVNVTLLADTYYSSEIVSYTTTSESGAYAFNNVHPGKYVVSFYDPQRPHGPHFYHQRLDFFQADRVVVEEGKVTPNIDQVIGGAPTALDGEGEPQAPTKDRMFLPLIAR